MRVFKKRDKWWIDYNFAGKRIRKPISKNKREAELALIKILSDKVERRYTPPGAKKTLFIDYAKKYLKEHSIPSKKSYKNDISRLKNLMPVFGGLYLDEISSDHFDHYRSKRMKLRAKNRSNLVSPVTINREGALLNSMLNKAVAWGLLKYNRLEIKKATETRKERILSETEMRLLVDMAKTPLKEMIVLALNTGLRKSEILNLKWNNVNLDSQFLLVETKGARTIKARRIKLNSALMDIFLVLKQKSEGDIFIFENPKTGLPFLDLKKSWYALLKRTGFVGLRFHDLRHCFAYHSLKLKGDVVLLQQILGLKNLGALSRYLQPLPDKDNLQGKCFEIPRKPF